jgi:hypothetical protein
MNAAINGFINGASSVSVLTWDGYGNDFSAYQATGVHIDDLGTLTLRTYSFAGLDQADITWQGDLDGRLNVAAVGGWGADDLAVNLTANSGSTGDLSAAVVGWWSPDTLTLNVFENGFDLNILSAYVDGGWYTADTITATGNVATYNA